MAYADQQLQAHPEAGRNPAQPRPQLSDKEIPPGVAYLTRSTGLRITPIQRKDDLISLFVTPTVEGRSVSVATTVKYDQSFAIQMSPGSDEQQVIVIVTARRG